MPLENDPANACVGCGPANPAGLRLVFEKTPEGARSTFAVDERWQGFPSRLHSGILYLALLETMNWSLHAKTGRMGLPSRTGALESRRWVKCGTAILLEGRVRAFDPTARTASLEAWAEFPDREVVARLERDYALVDETTFLERMGYDVVPSGYDGAFR
jgi:hypothetical protein